MANQRERCHVDVYRGKWGGREAYNIETNQKAISALTVRWMALGISNGSLLGGRHTTPNVYMSDAFASVRMTHWQCARAGQP